VQQSLCLGCWVFKRVLAPEKERAKKKKKEKRKKSEGNRAVIFLHSLLSWCVTTFVFRLTSLA
jgi:hypothetical protein